MTTAQTETPNETAVKKLNVKCPCCGDTTKVVPHCEVGPLKRCPARWLKCLNCRARISFFGFDGEILTTPRHSNGTHSERCLQPVFTPHPGYYPKEAS